MATFRLDIVTAERLVYSEEVSILVAPGMAGELAVLPHHAPLLTTLRPGEIRVVRDGEESFLAVSGGFMEVMGDRVTVLADTAERVEEIDQDRAEEAIRLAQERFTTASGEEDLARALASIRRSQARLKVVRRRRRGPQPEGPVPAG